MEEGERHFSADADAEGREGQPGDGSDGCGLHGSGCRGHHADGSHRITGRQWSLHGDAERDHGRDGDRHGVGRGAVLGGLQAQVSLAADITTAAVRTVTETTGGAKADNVSTNTLTATVEDANGNRVPNVTVDWSVTTGIATLNSATSTTDSNGQAVITVKDMTAETATITAKAGSNAADGGQTADTVFSLYPVVSGITQGVNNSPADNATQNTLTVQIADLAGNALKNQNVTLSLAGRT
ncbi:intimin [Citrobacter freundii]|nr:intimin [Citrobacter freundii]